MACSCEIFAEFSTSVFRTARRIETVTLWKVFLRLLFQPSSGSLQGRYWDSYIKSDRERKVIEFLPAMSGPRPLAAAPFSTPHQLSTIQDEHWGLPHHYSSA